MTIKQFIEKAVDGRWQPTFNKGMGVIQKTGDFKAKVKMGAPTLSYGDMFLDPLAWKAVGKVEGWIEKTWYRGDVEMPVWKNNMHCMIDALAEGKTIGQFLETL